MIQFFRKIRQGLFLEGNTAKYLSYALGEIILVIVGILIAIQVNNANERRNFNNEITEKVKALVVNLEDEIRVSGAFNKPEKIQNMQRFLDGELTADSLRLNPEYLNLSGIILKPDVMEENIEILIEKEDRLPERYKTLIPTMKSLKFYFSTYLTRAEEFRDLKRNNEMILENNYAWYSQNDHISNEQRVQYYSTDPLFKNRIYTVSQRLRGAFSLYSTTIIKKLEILYGIKRADENYTANDLRSYLLSPIFKWPEQFFNEGIKVSCDTEADGSTKVVSSHLIVNMSSDTLNLNAKNGSRIKMLPYATGHFNTSTDNDIIRVYRKNNCEAYQVSTTNFIIIE